MTTCNFRSLNAKATDTVLFVHLNFTIPATQLGPLQEYCQHEDSTILQLFEEDLSKISSEAKAIWRIQSFEQEVFQNQAEPSGNPFSKLKQFLQSQEVPMKSKL